MRVNARLDKETKEKLTYITENTGDNTSMVVKEAIARYYTAVKESERPAHILEKSGFIGCAEDAENLSAEYKELLDESLEKKHDHR